MFELTAEINQEEGVRSREEEGGRRKKEAGTRQNRGVWVLISMLYLI